MCANVKYDVIVLFNGYSKYTERGHLANCTCTLIKGPKNIIVDTMTAWDGEKLTEALRQQNLRCDDIDYVICTSTHSDHIGCNYLFPKAIHIVGFAISHGDVYFKHEFEAKQEYEIDSFIRVIPTPGNTLRDISVVVKTGDKGYIVIAGDLFQNASDLQGDNKSPLIGSQSKELHLVNRRKIANIADWIIPGHGPMFKVNQMEPI